MSIKRTVGLTAVIALMLGVMALPAAAGTGTGVFQGTADVGQMQQEVCTKQPGDGRPTGNGLYAPGGPGPTMGVSGFYRFTSPSALTWVDDNGNVVTAGGLDICGELGPVLGVGAMCGMSEGFNGTGKIFDDEGDTILGVKDVGWPATAAGTLPISGTIWDQHDQDEPGTEDQVLKQEEGQKDKWKDKERTLTGVVQATGGLGCVDANGAKLFTVVGTIEGI